MPLRQANTEFCFVVNPSIPSCFGIRTFRSWASGGLYNLVLLIDDQNMRLCDPLLYDGEVLDWFQSDPTNIFSLQPLNFD